MRSNRTATHARPGPWQTRLDRWCRERVDLEPLLTVAARKSVPVHRHGWIYFVGGAAVFLFGLQVATGSLLMLYYQPTAEAAHESVRRIMHEVPYGWLVRSVHVWGAQAFIAGVGFHFVTTLLVKAYRRPRELTWLSGVGLLLLAVTLGFSGYLLPWNELSYYATLVGTQIPGSLPGVGGTLVRLLRGGDQVTGETITRFYALHVAIVPAALAIVLAFHLALVQLQGMSLPLGLPRTKVRDEEPFFGEFLLTEICLWLVLFGAIVTLAVYAPAEISRRADPLQPAPVGIKPEWYFLFVFQLLKWVPEQLGVLLLVIGTAFLFAIPFLDRRAAREDRSPWFAALVCAVLAAAAGLELRCLLSPSAEPAIEELVAETYRPAADSVWLLFLWLVIGFLVYGLQRLRQNNRRLRKLR